VSCKISRAYDLSRALVCTNSATNALVVINTRNKVLDLDGSLLTALLTDLTSDTAYVAVISGYFTVVNRHTAYPISTVIGYKLDDILRTSGDTGTASGTFIIIDVRYTLDDLNSVEVTA